MHPGWAAQAGLRAVALARAGFDGPRTVWEGEHGFFHGFANTLDGDWGRLIEGFGEEWIMGTIAFKPYACGTMIHPYIDCARRLAAQGVQPQRIRDVVCETAEGIVHRLWEPIAVKHRPPTPYSAKFSIPYCLAYGFIHGAVGLDAFGKEHVRDPRLLELAGKVRYEIDPANPYPNEYTGHVRVTLDDGSVIEERQPHLRGGAREPLTREELERKFRGNCMHGGWAPALAQRWLDMAHHAFERGIELEAFRA
jgi:2-methylcitrate dehydratase PrpD